MTTADNDFEKISQLVLENAIGNPELVQPNLELIRPVFENFNSGQWKFGEEMDPQGLREAIKLAIDVDVRKVILVSISSLLRLPRQSSIVFHNDIIAEINRFGVSLHNRLNLGLRASLNHNARLNLGSLLSFILGGSIHGSINNSLGINIVDRLRDDYAYNMWLVFRKNVRGSLKINLKIVIATNIYNILFVFLGFTITGDTEKIRLLTPIIRLLATGVVPLCEKVNESGSYLVAVA